MVTTKRKLWLSRLLLSSFLISLSSVLALEVPLEIKLGQAFTLDCCQGGEYAAAYQPAKFNLEFLSVTNDSRCPKGAACVWAGDATVLVQIGREQVKLHTGLEPRSVVRKGHRLKLIKLEPQRGEPGPPKATFVLAKR